MESSTTLRWTAAEEKCKTFGGHLASVRDKDDMKIIQALPIDHHARRGTKVYIGRE